MTRPAGEYCPPPWLPGGHAQTIFPLLIKPRPPAYRRERWTTPDDDFIDVDWCESTDAGAPLLVLFHGLEGSSRSHYATSLMRMTRQRGWAGAVPHFRGCSGELNHRPRAYHSGDSQEIDWILRRLRAQHPRRPLFVVGVSLGGNALLKWLGEQGARASALASKAAAICPPFDLAACGHQLATGFNRVYTRHFLRTLKAGAKQRLERFPGLFDGDRMARARTLWEFDDAVTAPIHGFAGADDYWTRASSKAWLRHVALPTLLISPRNDPFLPPSAFPRPDELSPAIRFETPAAGGHVGFVRGTLPGRLDWLPNRIFSYFLEES